jgi:hypothetical protein
MTWRVVSEPASFSARARSGSSTPGAGVEGVDRIAGEEKGLAGDVAAGVIGEAPGGGVSALAY